LLVVGMSLLGAGVSFRKTLRSIQKVRPKSGGQLKPEPAGAGR
jgi:hypothetical protein